MIREIGSEYHYDSELFTSNDFNLFGNVVLTSCGRDAITLFIDEMIILDRCKRVAIPAYICESVIIPFINKGFECVFFDIEFSGGEQNIIFTDELKTVDVFIFMGYFGFELSEKTLRKIEVISQLGIYVVEDVTHSLFTNLLLNSKRNDWEVASLRKWFGIPTGGYLYSNTNIENNNIKQLNEDKTLFMIKRKQALDSKTKFLEGKASSGNYRNLFEDAEIYLNNRVEICLMDSLSKNLLNKVNLNYLVSKRQDNYDYLCKELEKSKLVERLFPKLSNKIVPLFFPVFVKSEGARNKLQTILSENRVYCPIHWPKPEQVNIENFSNAEKIYNQVLSIPIDQRYDLKDMERIVKVLKDIGDINEKNNF